MCYVRRSGRAGEGGAGGHFQNCPPSPPPPVWGGTLRGRRLPHVTLAASSLTQIRFQRTRHVSGTGSLPSTAALPRPVSPNCWGLFLPHQ